jgi:hypothetical protein
MKLAKRAFGVKGFQHDDFTFEIREVNGFTVEISSGEIGRWLPNFRGKTSHAKAHQHGHHKKIFHKTGLWQ